MPGRRMLAAGVLNVGVLAGLFTAALVPLPAGAQQRQVREERQQHRPLRSVGEPGRVAAADFAIPRTARELGQWAAYRETAASGALVHDGEGPVDLARWLAAQAQPAVPDAGGPNTVWSSCDGTLAVTFGRFRTGAGLVGSYARVWALQGERRYKWTYQLAAPDDPQPPPPLPEVQPDIDTIVVPGLLSIDGRVADCPRRGSPVPTAPAAALADGAMTQARRSDDGTLQWRWEHLPDGTRLFVAEYWREGRWQQAVDLRVPPPRSTPPVARAPAALEGS